MTKWADYCVIAVKYGRERTPIVEVEVKPDTGDSLGASQKVSRAAVVTAISRGNTFVTALKKADGKWEKGAAVRAIEIHREMFLRTDENAIRADNLGRLPEYS